MNKLILLLIFEFLFLFSYSDTTQNSFIQGDSLEQILPHLKGKEKIRTLMKLIVKYHGVDVKKNLRYGKMAEKLASKINDPYITQEVYRGIGAGYCQISDYDIALNYFIKSLNICKDINNITNLAANYNNIAAIYYDMQQFEKSANYFNKSLDIFITHNNYYEMAAVYANAGSAYLQLGKPSLAKEYLNKSIAINKNILKNKIKEIRDLSLLAQIYEEERKYDRGIEACNTAMKVAKDANVKNLHVLSELSETIAQLYIKKKDYKNAKIQLAIMLQYATEINSKIQLRSVYKLLTEISEKTNHLKNAYKYQKLYVAYNDSVLTETQINELFEQETKYQISQMEQEIELINKDRLLLQEREKVASQQKYIWYGSFLIILFLLSIVIFTFKQRLKKSKLEEVILTNKLTYTKNELTTFALTIVQKNDALELLKENMTVLNKIDNIEDRKKTVRSLLYDLSTAMGLEQDKIIIKSKIHDLEDEYLRQLEKQFPNLSKNDKQLAVMLRSNFTSKEIASIFNISHHSVNVSRYRLRKKLNLNKGDDLVAFLNSL